MIKKQKKGTSLFSAVFIALASVFIANVSSAQFIQNGSDIYFTSGKVGVGTANPASALHVGENDGTEQVPRGAIILSRYWNSATDVRGSSLFHYKAVGCCDKLVFAVAGDGCSFMNPVDISMAKMVVQADGRIGIEITASQVRLDVAGQVRVVDGTQAQGKVLTSDANGVASWQQPATNISNSLLLSGGSLSGGLAMNDNRISLRSIGDPFHSLQYVNGQGISIVDKEGVVFKPDNISSNNVFFHLPAV